MDRAIEFLLILLKGLGVSVLVSLMLLYFFVKTINRFPKIRTAFRILHRLSIISLYICIYVFIPLLVITLTNLFLSAFGVVSMPFDFAEEILLQSCKIMVITLIFILSVNLIICAKTIQLLKLTHRIEYEKYGPLAGWGNQTRRFKKEINWMPVVIEQLEPLLKIWAVQSPILRIVAPAANNGQEELVLAEELAARLNCKIRMWTSDGSPMDHQAPVTTSQVEFTYEQLDAYALPQVITDPQDIIYDPKGILWFSFGKLENLMPALRLFYDLLSPSGFILIDAHDYPKGGFHLNRLRLLFGRKIRNYCEPSTYHYIHQCFTDGSAASELFKLEMIDGLEGPYKMAILRKRPEDQSQWSK
ncbi:hypothetical protein M2444_004703 [Paenibacillus sp. PastF-3]|nr:hypothetical protein [Paenibacillus sp. PastF-3]